MQERQVCIVFIVFLSLVFMSFASSNLKNPQWLPTGYRTKSRFLGMPFKTAKSKAFLAPRVPCEMSILLVTVWLEGCFVSHWPGDRVSERQLETR